MIIYYRMCPRKSPLSVPSPIYADDPLRLHEMCLRSFVEAFRDVDPEMMFIADYCPPEYEEMVERVVPFTYKYMNTELGINETCLLQYKLFEESSHHTVLFQEYDYLWVGKGEALGMALGELEFVTPYLHPDKYPQEDNNEVREVSGHSFIHTSSTTATFATTRPNFEKYKDIFYKYGYLDKARWEEIGGAGGRLWAPKPTLSTHMVEGYMATGIEWDKQYAKYTL